MLKLVHESALLTAAVVFLLAVASIYQFLMGMLGVPALLGEILRPSAGDAVALPAGGVASSSCCSGWCWRGCRPRSC